MRSFSHLVKVVTSSENDCTRSYSLSKTPIFDTCSITNEESKPFTGLAFKLKVERSFLTCLLILFEGVWVWNKPGGWLSQKWYLSCSYIYAKEANMEGQLLCLYHASSLIPMTKTGTYLGKNIWGRNMEELLNTNGSGHLGGPRGWVWEGDVSPPMESTES